jgi:hypothetical protein
MNSRTKTSDPGRRGAPSRESARRPAGPRAPEPGSQSGRIPDIEELPDGFGQRRKRD